MATNTKNTTATTSPVVDTETVMKAIADIRQAVPILKDLTTEERKSIARIGTRGIAFVHKAVAIAQQNPQIMPPSLSLEQMQQDADLLITATLIALDQLRKQVDDTAIFVGGKAYSAARMVYVYAASAGPALETATAQLGQHFARKGNGHNGAAKAEAPDAEPPVTAT
jgi:hypothetical protein